VAQTPAAHTNPRRASGARTSITVDLLVVAGVTLLAAFASAQLELSERIQRLARPLEWLQADELPNVLFVLALALAWFAWRRYREAREALVRSTAAEATLAHALAENRRLATGHVAVQEAERRALARELHDELGQTINAIRIDAVEARERARADDDRRIAAGLLRGIEHLHATVRGLIRDLRPVALDELGLRAAITHCVDEWRTRLRDTRFEPALSPAVDDLDEASNIALFRVLQEALTNIAKHAQPDEVRIVLAREPGGTPHDVVRLRVVNDGVRVTAPDRSPAMAGLGLLGMRERIHALGGTFAATAAGPDRFEVVATLPCPAGRQAPN